MLTVVKMGGTVLEEGLTESFLEDVKKSLSETRLVLVHGGGKKVTEVSLRLGKEQQFITSPDGFRSRHTDKETMEIFTMVMAGKINKNIVSSLQAHNIPAVGITGIDGASVQASRKKQLVSVDERGRKRLIEGGYTGKIVAVNTNLLNLLLTNNYLPVIAPIAIGQEFEELNVDGDRMAAHIAGSLNADRLILLTDVEGLIIDGVTIRKITIGEAESILPKIGKGMITKIHAATEAIKQGVNQVNVTSGLESNPISNSLKKVSGTVIVHG